MDVLLVEDEPLVRETLGEDLADAGLDVVTAPTAEDAIAAAERDGQPPAVIVTDVNLGPGMDGLALAEQARRRWPGVGVVIMTGDPRNLPLQVSDDSVLCLMKPFSPPLLVAEVNELLGRSRR